MKKRLLCLTLGILMLLSCLLTACGNSNDSDETDGSGTTTPVVDNSAKTITMWVLTNKETTPRAQKLVNKEFTRITKSKFKTNVQLVFCSEEGYWELVDGEYKWNDTGYYERLEEAIEKNEEFFRMQEEADYQLRVFRNANKDKGWSEVQLVQEFCKDPRYEQWWPYVETPVEEDEDEETSETEEETILNEYEIAELKYPDAKENQVDIFYIGNIGNVTGESKYFEYYNNEWLASLNESLSGVAGKLNKYIAPALLGGVQIDGTAYGIPNNVPIGEYTYMMIDYDLLSTYKCTINDTDTVADKKVANFLKDMADYNKANGLGPDDEGYVVPLNSTLAECMQMLVWYWEINYVDRSVYATYEGVPCDENGEPIADAGVRDYTLMQEYVTVEEEAADDDSEETVKKYTYSAYYSILDGMLYKVNADGRYVDKDGNPLYYSYVLDENGGYMSAVAKDFNTKNDIPDAGEDDKATKEGEIIWHERAANSWYLVDENGNPVTAANDKRVILADASMIGAVDEDGNEIITGSEGNYKYKNHPVEISSTEIICKRDDSNRVLPTYVFDWNRDCNFSGMGTVMKDPTIRDRGDINLGFNNLFDDKEYAELYTTLMGYQFNGYFGTPDETKGQTAAVSFVKGDASILANSLQSGKMTVNGEDIYKPAGVYVDPETGKWYRVVVAENPTATSADLYGSMFAVYARSEYLDRSMKVINYLNTNTELRDILQYGVEDVHFSYEETKATSKGEKNTILVKTLIGHNEMEMTNEQDKADANGIYSMDVTRTGNCFITTPTEEQGASIWEYAKMQNTNSQIDPMLGFDFQSLVDDMDTVPDVTLLYRLNKVNVAAKACLESCGNVQELSAQFDDAKSELRMLFKETATAGMVRTATWVQKLTNESYDVNGTGANATPDLFGESINTIYFNWLRAYGYLYVEEEESAT